MTDLPWRERMEEELRIARFDASVAQTEKDAAIAAATMDLRTERDRYREALEQIADHSQEFTREVHGYAGYGQALGHVHDTARSALEGKS